MDAYEATRVVFSRIQALDAENAAKIMGFLLIQDHGEKEMIRLAFGPETLLHSVILKTRKELSLHPPSSPSSAPISPSPFHQLSRQNSASSRFAMAPPPPSLTITSPSWAPPLPSSDPAQCPSDDLIISPNQSPAAASCTSPFYGDFVEDFPPIQDQISFVNDPYQDMGGGGWVPGGPHHRRSFSAATDICLSSDGDGGFGWKPCLYFARGFCKNGSSCRFLHGLHDDGSKQLDAAIEQQCQELLLRSKSQRLAAAFPYSPTGSMPISPSSSKCMNYLLQQQQNESHRALAAAAAALMLGGDESHKFMGRSRMDRSDFAGMLNPGSRQIYLTFPADSTFREEDVSNYFSIYGPVQDVRIPYQQKRMFGFVTFVYPETVKLILAKGNPHFVCDARVLVKPYKEKGKIPDKYRKQQQSERVDFSGCTTPTPLDSRDPYDLQQLGARMLYNSSNSNQEMLLRRKLEEQQQAAELQQAIEMQGRRFMGLQLLDFKNRSSVQSSSTTISSPTTITSSLSNERSHEESPTGDKSSSPASSDGEHQQLKAVNPAAAADKEESAARMGSPNEFQESAVEHNLPDNPFASPTKASSLFAEDPFAGPGPAASALETELGGAGSTLNNGNGNGLMASSLLPPTTTLDMASLKSCFLQMPRFSSGHGAVGL